MKIIFGGEQQHLGVRVTKLITMLIMILLSEILYTKCPFSPIGSYAAAYCKEFGLSKS